MKALTYRKGDVSILQSHLSLLQTHLMDVQKWADEISSTLNRMYEELSAEEDEAL